MFKGTSLHFVHCKELERDFIIFCTLEGTFVTYHVALDLLQKDPLVTHTFYPLEMHPSEHFYLFYLQHHYLTGQFIAKSHL